MYNLTQVPVKIDNKKLWLQEGGVGGSDGRVSDKFKCQTYGL